MYGIVLVAALSGNPNTMAVNPAYYSYPGVVTAGSCMGCYGSCHGSCIGGVSSGCFGGCVGVTTQTRYMLRYSCHGGMGCSGCHGHWSWQPISCVVTNPTAPVSVRAPESIRDVKTPCVAGAAHIVLDLPVGAKVFVEGQLIAGAGTTRRFQTPVLQPGKTYYYVLTVEAIEGGRPIEETRRILVHAGETVHESFGGATTALASAH